MKRERERFRAKNYLILLILGIFLVGAFIFVDFGKVNFSPGKSEGEGESEGEGQFCRCQDPPSVYDEDGLIIPISWSSVKGCPAQYICAPAECEFQGWGPGHNSEDYLWNNVVPFLKQQGITAKVVQGNGGPQISATFVSPCLP